MARGMGAYGATLNTGHFFFKKEHMTILILNSKLLEQMDKKGRHAPWQMLNKIPQQCNTEIKATAWNSGQKLQGPRSRRLW